MANRSTTVKTFAVVAAAAGLAALMLLYEPGASEHVIVPPTATATHAPVAAPPIVQTEAPEPVAAPVNLASLPPISKSIPPRRSLRPSSSEIAAMSLAAEVADGPLGCLKRIEFDPPAVLAPPINRPFTHITVTGDGVDYGKVPYTKLPNGNWLVFIPSRCDAGDPGKEMVVVISFWPNHPKDVGPGIGPPLQYAISSRKIVVE